MQMEDLDAHWHALSDEVITQMKEWRMQHPRATFQEIETALDERLARLRVRLLEDAALVSRAADLTTATEEERPGCPECGTRMELRGHPTRELLTNHDQTIELKRRDAVCPQGHGGIFPLDEELQLLPGRLTPALAESLVHLGTWMPFGRAVKELHYFHRVHLTEATVRRETETAGAADVTVQTDQVEHRERTTPTPPAGPPLQRMSVDGACIRLVHGEWAEVKTLAIGDVQPPVTDAQTGESVVPSTNLSYFSRLADAETFGRRALVETQRRGTETAKQVCAVSDGAEWEPGFVDLHRRDAVRILDFRHAGGYVVAAGDAVWGDGSDASKTWWEKRLHELKQGSPDLVLAQLRELRRRT